MLHGAKGNPGLFFHCSALANVNKCTEQHLFKPNLKHLLLATAEYRERGRERGREGGRQSQTDTDTERQRQRNREKKTDKRD